MAGKHALVTGAAGELGSTVSRILTEKGYTVTGVDTVRKDEAWRLEPVSEDLVYVWKDARELSAADVDRPDELDLVIDCAAISDRPFGTTSPHTTTRVNIEAPLNLLESFKPYDPIFIYPASGVEMLGVPEAEQPITEDTDPRPVNVYGWSKFAAEHLYRTYEREYGIQAVITRSGSVYGEGMRTNQAIAQFILKTLRKEDITVRNPYATRTPQYVGDVTSFYTALFEQLEEHPATLLGETLISGGNADGRDYTVLEMAEVVRDVAGADINITPADDHEPGEKIGDTYVKQHIVPTNAVELLDWEPAFTFYEGIERTIAWFEETRHVRTG